VVNKLVQRIPELTAKLLNRLLPGICVLCEMSGQSGRDLCEHCHETLPWNLHACRRCGEPQPRSSNRCLACPTDWPITNTVAPLIYAAPVQSWLHGLKFDADLVAGRLLGQLLADAVGQAYRGQALPQVLVPVPIHWRRLMGRGLNQAAVLAGPAKRRFALPVATSGVIRAHRHFNQQQLSRVDRLHNLVGVFTSKPWQQQHIAIVDDVATTGATASALATVCLAAGASRVDLWCAARTPAPK